MKNGEIVFRSGQKYIYWCGLSFRYVVQHIFGSVDYDDAFKKNDFEEAKRYCLSNKNKPLD